jgi:hypothetical protein
MSMSAYSKRTWRIQLTKFKGYELLPRWPVAMPHGCDVDKLIQQQRRACARGYQARYERALGESRMPEADANG